MSETSWAALIAFLTYVGIRVVDYLLPKGRHWTFVNRWSEKDDNPHPEDEEG